MPHQSQEMACLIEVVYGGRERVSTKKEPLNVISK